MTNPHLVSHLQSQTRRRVGLAAYPVNRAALDALRSEGVEIAVLDCIGGADLESVCESISHLRLISGSSAPAMKLPDIWRREGWWHPSGAVLERPAADGCGFLTVAGSCAEATRRQNEWLEMQGSAPLVLENRTRTPRSA